MTQKDPRKTRPEDQIVEIYEGRIALPQPVQPTHFGTLPQPVGPRHVVLPQPVPRPQEILDEHARLQSALLGKKVVTVYVRKGDHPRERIVSVNPFPPGTDEALLDAGFALDGNSATVSVTRNTFVYETDARNGNLRFLELAGEISKADDQGAEEEKWTLEAIQKDWSLTRALNIVERTLVRWLTKLGYEVKFG